MNIIKEIEQILRHPTFMSNDITGCNLAANAILDRLDELGLEIAKKEIVDMDEILFYSPWEKISEE